MGVAFFPRASAFGLQPWARVSQPVGPVGRGWPVPIVSTGRETLTQGRPARLLGRSSIPHVAFVKLDLIGLEERAEFLLKSLHSVVLALVADVSPHFLDLRLAHRERPESSLPEEPLELRASATKPIVRAFLEVSDNVAQSLGPARRNRTCRWSGSVLISIGKQPRPLSVPPM